MIIIINIYYYSLLFTFQPILNRNILKNKIISLRENANIKTY